MPGVPPPTGAGEEPRRRTPSPCLVRFLTGGLFVLGVLLGLPGVLVQSWSLRLTLDLTAAGDCFLALNLGFLPALLLSSGTRAAVGRAARFRLTAGGVLSAAGIVWLTQVYVAEQVLPPLAVLGAGAGLIASGSCRLLCAALPNYRLRSTLGLAALAFGCGPAAVALLFGLALGGLPFAALLSIAAAVPSTLAVLAWTNGRLRRLQTGPLLAGPLWRDFCHPGGAVMALLGLLQTALLWMWGGWLALYLFRTLGLGIRTGLLALALFWIAVLAARVFAFRSPPLAPGGSTGFAPAALAVAGTLFLLHAGGVSGALAGALLTGAGLGLLQPLSLEFMAAHMPCRTAQFVRAAFYAGTAGGLFAPWAGGLLAARWGLDAIAWSCLAASAALFILVRIMMLEAQLMQGSAA